MGCDVRRDYPVVELRVAVNNKKIRTDGPISMKQSMSSTDVKVNFGVLIGYAAINNT